MSQYMITRETRTLEVFAIEADRPLDASIEFGRLLGSNELVAVHSSILSVKYGQPQVAVADPAAAPASVDRDVDRADDHQDRKDDENGDTDDAGSGAHADSVPAATSGQTR